MQKHGPDIGEFVQVLRSMPLLKTLGILSLNFTRSNQGRGGQPLIVLLHHLGSLALRGTMHQCTKMLENIQCPNTVRLDVDATVTTRDDHDSARSFLAAIASKREGLPPLIVSPVRPFQSIYWNVFGQLARKHKVLLSTQPDVYVLNGVDPKPDERNYDVCLTIDGGVWPRRRQTQPDASLWTSWPPIRDVRFLTTGTDSLRQWLHLMRSLDSLEALSVVVKPKDTGTLSFQESMRVLLRDLSKQDYIRFGVKHSDILSPDWFLLPCLRILNLQGALFWGVPNRYPGQPDFADGLRAALQARKAGGIMIERLIVCSAVNCEDADIDMLRPYVATVDWDGVVQRASLAEVK